MISFSERSPTFGAPSADTSQCSSRRSREAVEACIVRGVHEHQPEYDITYYGFVDPSGGSGRDSMTLCIGHRNSRKGVVIIDCVHAYDNFTLASDVALPDAQTTRNCLILEGDNGVLLNSKNGQFITSVTLASKKDPTWATMRRRTRQPSKPSNNFSPPNLSWLATKDPLCTYQQQERNGPN
jgi:hypothetical protein